MPNIRTLYIDVSKDVRFRGYFSTPQRAREPKRSGNTNLFNSLSFGSII
jgi:hypothetical protein